MMPYKDSADKAAYQRDYMRNVKGKTKDTDGCILDPAEIQDAKGIRKLMAEVIADVRGTKADPIVRARAIGYLAQIQLKAVETADLAERIEALEAALEHIQ